MATRGCTNLKLFPASFTPYLRTKVNTTFQNFVFSPDRILHISLNVFFFFFIAFCTSSFHHYVLPCSLCFLFPQSSSQAFKTSSLGQPHKSFASVLTNFFLVSFYFNFRTLYCMFHFIFMCLNKFSFFTSTTINLCCSSQKITLTSFILS